jgi:FkbM family methyltransferase
MEKAIGILAYVLKRLPQGLRDALYEVVLKYIPICFLRRIPCSYSTYLKCYTPKKGDVVLDCGAHIGNCTILFARLVGKRGIVVALEPFEDSFRALRRRVKRNRFTNVIAIKKAAWEKTETKVLRVMPNTIGCRISEQEIKRVKDSETRIRCIAIDDLVNDLGLQRLDMIKMDIEGAEIEALAGSKRVIERLSPRFAIASYHRRNGQQTAMMVQRYLTDCAYTVETFFPAHLTTCAVNRMPLLSE